jgi:hypothetical protein
MSARNTPPAQHHAAGLQQVIDHPNRDGAIPTRRHGSSLAQRRSPTAWRQLASGRRSATRFATSIWSLSQEMSLSPLKLAPSMAQPRRTVGRSVAFGYADLLRRSRCATGRLRVDLRASEPDVASSLFNLPRDQTTRLCHGIGLRCPVIGPSHDRRNAGVETAVRRRYGSEPCHERC